MTKDCEIKARVPESLKRALAAAAAAQYQTESEFIRQAVIAQLRAVKRLPVEGA